MWCLVLCSPWGNQGNSNTNTGLQIHQAKEFKPWPWGSSKGKCSQWLRSLRLMGSHTVPVMGGVGAGVLLGVSFSCSIFRFVFLRRGTFCWLQKWTSYLSTFLIFSLLPIPGNSCIYSPSQPSFLSFKNWPCFGSEPAISDFFFPLQPTPVFLFSFFSDIVHKIFKYRFF